MNDVDVKTIRLQPRQLYDMIVERSNSFPECLNSERIKKFGQYTDKESIRLASADMDYLIMNFDEKIEVIQTAIVLLRSVENNIPYLHEICQNNERYANLLGLNNMGDEITFGKIIGNLSPRLKTSIKLMTNVKIPDMNMTGIQQSGMPNSKYNKDNQSFREAHKDLLHQMNSYTRLQRFAYNPNANI